MQAAILNVKLKYLDEWNTARIDHAKFYTQILQPLEQNLEFTLPKVASHVKHVYHMYILRAEN